MAKATKEEKRVSLNPQAAQFVKEYAIRTGLSESEVMQRAIEAGISRLASDETALLINKKTVLRLEMGQLE